MGESNLSTLNRKLLIIILWTGQDHHPNQNLFLSLASNPLFFNGMGMALLLDTF